MSALIELISAGVEFPIEYVVALIALGVIALSGFAIYVVHSLAKRKHD
jgi:hypothetical protein